MGQAQRNYQKRNRAKINARRRRWRQRPDVKEREKKQIRKHYIENREQILAKAKISNKKRKAKIKAWKDKNRDVINAKRREHYQLKKEVINDYQRQWYRKNQKKAVGYQKKFRDKHKDRLKPIISERGKKYRAKHPDKVKRRKKQYYTTHREEILKKEKNRYLRNPKRVVDNVERWRKNNPDKTKAQKKIGSKRMRERITDAYVRQTLGFKKQDNVPKGLIEAKRAVIKLKRIVNHAN